MPRLPAPISSALAIALPPVLKRIPEEHEERIFVSSWIFYETLDGCIIASETMPN